MFEFLLPLISAGLQAAAVTKKIQATNAAAKAEADAAVANDAIAARNYAYGRSQLEGQLVDADARTVAQKIDDARAAMHARGEVVAAAAESGIAGGAVDRALFSINVNLGITNQAKDTALTQFKSQVAAENNNEWSARRSRNMQAINDVEQARASILSPTTSAFQIGLTGATAFLQSKSAMAGLTEPSNGVPQLPTQPTGAGVPFYRNDKVYR
jgi:hypothetical protein